MTFPVSEGVNLSTIGGFFSKILFLFFVKWTLFKNSWAKSGDFSDFEGCYLGPPKVCPPTEILAMSLVVVTAVTKYNYI